MPNIRIYSTRWCGYCHAAKRFLAEVKSVEFEEIDLTGDSDGRHDLRARSGSHTVPQIYIGEVHVGGYDDMRAMDARGELDPLLAT